MWRRAIRAAAVVAAMAALVLSVRGSERRGLPSRAVLYDLTVDHRREPLGVERDRICFGWKLDSEETGQRQTAYRLRVAGTLEELAEDGRLLWDSGVVEGDETTDIPYGGAPLADGETCYWEVTCWDAHGNVTEPAVSSFETALGEEAFAEEKTAWIAAPREPVSPRPAGTYRILLRLRLEDQRAGVVWAFSAEDRAMLRQQIVLGDEVTLVTELIADGAVCWSRTSEPLPLDAAKLRGNTFSWELRAGERRVTTWVEGQEVWTEDLSEVRRGPGAFGLHQDRGNRAWVKSLSVTMENGDTVLEEDFEDPSHTVFGEQPCFINERKELCADGALLLEAAGSGADAPAPLFHRDFCLREGGQVEEARLYLSAAGVYEAWINGARVADTRLDPGNTAYGIRMDYQTHDVTDLLTPGENALTVCLGHGWYDRAVGYEGTGVVWGDRNAIRGFLRVCYRDGSEEVFPTDGSWRVCADGPVRGNDLWQGVVYDARRERKGFARPGFARGKGWTGAETIDPEGPAGELVPQRKEPVRIVREVEGAALAPPVGERAAGRMRVYDLGEEIAGVCRVRVKGPAGAEILLRHGEWRNGADMANRDGPPGTVFTKNLYGAQSIDRYILRGDPQGETFVPPMTFHGFRYVEVRTASPEVEVVSVTGLALSSDLEPAGEFRCGDGRINGLMDSIERTREGNSISIPTDCPQRSERFGWAGDAQAFAPTALDLADGYVWYADYVRALSETQDPASGSVGDMAPRNFGGDASGRGGHGGNNVWGDAIVTIPWELYCRYGTEEILEDSYDGIRRWIGYLEAHQEDWVRPEAGYGDFLALDDASLSCVNTAYSARACALAARIAQILGKEGDAERFREDADRFRQAFGDHWVTESGWTRSGSEGSFVLGIAFDLFPEQFRSTAIDRLAETIAGQGGRMTTGFAATPYLLGVLSGPASGARGDLAWSLLLDESPTSLLFARRKGATTIWEQRDAWQEREDGSYALYGSLSHPAFGSVGHWLFSGCLGIQYDEAEPGFGHFFLRPVADERIAWAEGSYESVRGRIESGWSCGEEGAVYRVRVPANTTATLLLPRGDWEVREEASGREPEGVTVEEARGEAAIDLPSGVFVIDASEGGEGQ